MANRIQLLPDHVANQIAAGEVVQRPASVVKELLENAIDAGAMRIELLVKDGGKALVQVVDDGSGMSPADAGLSFRRHATSKISKAEDLFHLQTKGFRGEALASIAAIAQVELTTRDAEAELGTRLRIAGDTVQGTEAVVTPQGTSIQVKNLFFNIPARRNFLKSAQVEFRHVLDEFQRVALAHPGIAFRMVHNESEVHHLPVSNLKQRIDHLFGNRMNARLVPVAEETQIVAIGGFVCKPEFARKSRGEQFFFVNDRFIRSPYLHHAVMAAFEGLLRSESYPGYFLYLQVPPESIDINIHPTKTEVKFENEQSLYAILRSAVKHSLGQFNIAPVLDFEQDQNLETPYDYKDREAMLPGVSVDRNFNPFAGEKPASRNTGSYRPAPTRGWEARYEGLDPDPELQPADWVIESETRQEPLFDEGTAGTPGQAGLFQLGRKYILTRIKSGLLLIDQQRAHQRVLYEQLLQNLSRREPASQALLFPLQLAFGRAEMHILRSMEEALAGLGFRFSDAAGDTLELTGLPVLVPESEAASVLDQLISDWQRHDGAGDFSQVDRVAKELCRALAVKPGTPLDPESQLGLVNDLFGCKEPAMSPFNKPIHVTLPLEELEKKLNFHG